MQVDAKIQEASYEILYLIYTKGEIKESVGTKYNLSPREETIHQTHWETIISNGSL